MRAANREAGKGVPQKGYSIVGFNNLYNTPPPPADKGGVIGVIFGLGAQRGEINSAPGAVF